MPILCPSYHFTCLLVQGLHTLTVPILSEARLQCRENLPGHRRASAWLRQTEAPLSTQLHPWPCICPARRVLSAKGLLLTELGSFWRSIGIAAAVFKQVLVGGVHRSVKLSFKPSCRCAARPLLLQAISFRRCMSLNDTMATFQVGGLSHSFTASRSSRRFPHLHGPIKSIRTRGLCLRASSATHPELAAAIPCQQIPLQGYGGDDGHLGKAYCQESRHLVEQVRPRHKQAFPQDVACDSCPEVTTHWRCRRQVLSREETEYSEHQL